MLRKILSFILSIIMLLTGVSFGDIPGGSVGMTDGITPENEIVESERNEDFALKEATDGNWLNYATSVTADTNKVYSITTEAQLAYIAQIVNGGNKLSGYTVKLMNDLDLKGHEWTPIGVGESEVSFQGTFDGNNHTIANLTIDSDTYGIGLFGLTNSAVIKNVGIISPEIISTATSKVNVSGDENYTWGVGALVGYASKTTFSNCFVRDGYVRSLYRVGGLIGNISEGTSTLKNCYIQGTFVHSTTGESRSFAGGIVGVVTAENTKFEYCYSTATAISGYANQSGSLFGATNKTTTELNSCYGLSTLYGKLGTTVPAVDANTSVVTEETLKVLTSTNINGGSGYVTDTGLLLNDGYPRFSWEIGWIDTAVQPTLTDTTYEIYTPSEFAYIAQLVNGGNKLSGYTVKLMNDLDLSRYIWMPIGGNGSTTTFRGTFDGNGHIISGLKIHSSTFGVGIFGFSIQATLKNVGIILPDVYTTYSEDATTRAYGVGALSGAGIGITVENCFVRGGSVTAYYRAAALVSNIMSEEAWRIGSSFSNCYVQGTTVTSTGSTVNSIVGGLTSLVSIDTVFNNCYSTAKCSSGRKQSVGSVIGGIAVSTVVNFNDVYSTETMGGIYNNAERDPVYSNSEIVTATKLKNLDRTTLNNSYAYREDNENKNDGYPVLAWELPDWADKATSVTPSNNVYSITTESELAYIAKLVRGGNTLSGYTVKLMNDLDLGGYEWTPIGGGGTTIRFKGTFDGNNHTIAGLKITSDKYGIGLFGLAENATIKNVGLIEPDVSNTYSSVTESDKFSHGTAALLGYGMGVTVQGCFIREGSVTSAYRAGGIVGNISSTASTITNCYVQGTTVISTGTANTAYAGGIAGVITATTTFNYCYSTAKCTSGYSNHTGSVLGATTQTSTALNSCYGTTTIHGKYNGSTSPKLDSYSSVVTEGTLKVLSSTNINGGSGYVTDTGILLNDGYPRFSWETGWIDTAKTITADSNNVYSIMTPEELAYIAKLVNGGNNLSGYTIRLMNDLDLSRYIWTPIGGVGATKQFVGIFDGNSHTISGLKVDATTSAIGLFGISSGGIFKNIGIINPTVASIYTTNNAGYNSHGTGALLGYGMGVTVENCFVREGSITSAYRAGGIIGNISSTESYINNCYVQGTTVTSTGTTNSAYAGGLIGVVTAKTNFNFCYSTATVTSGYSFVGSICGTTTVNTTAPYCAYATGKLFGGSVTPQYPISSKVVTEDELKDLTKTNINNDNAFVSDNMIDNDVNDDFPRLLWEVEWVGPETSKPKSDGNTYYIYNAKELAWISEQVTLGFTFSDNTIKLMDNIDLAGYGWIPIGGRDYWGKNSTTTYFAGTFDGNYKKISNLYVSDEFCYSGLFGYTYGATIKNTGIINPYINSTMTGGGASFPVGGLIGRATSTVTDRCYVRGGIVSSSGLLSVGGLIGATITTACTTTNSYVQGTTVKATRVHNDSSAGGIIGCAYLAADVVGNCYSTAVVTTASSEDNAGAIVGRSGGAVHITNCYGAGDIGSAADSILAGYNASSYSGNVSEECAIVPSDTLRTYAKKLNVQAFAEDHKKINNGFPVHISEYDVVYEEYFYYTVSDNQATITGVKPILKGEITIPETLGGNKVVAIADRAFSGNDTITSVRISNSVTSIGQHAFYNCGEIVSISIPASVKEIGLQAFYRCESLDNLYLDDIAVWCSIDFEDYYTNPLYYAENLYLNRTLVTALEIPSGVTSIGDFAFYGCDSISTAAVGNSVKTIGRGAFGDCSKLARMDIGTGVTSISADAFNNCINLKNIFVDAGNSTYSSSNGILFDEAKTTVVKYPEGKTETAYSIPNTVVTVGEYAFADADNLRTLTIGTNVKYISDYAYYNCDNLTTVTANSKVEKIGDSAFEKCELITGITLPDTLTTIGDHAFSNCTSITTLETGDAVTSVGAYVFNGCTGLIEISFGRSVTEYFGDGVFNDCSALADVITPYGTESIGLYTFHGCTSLAWVAMPDTLTSIDHRAFAQCSALEMIHFIGTEGTFNALTIDATNISYISNSTIHYMDWVTVTSPTGSSSGLAQAGCDECNGRIFYYKELDKLEIINIRLHYNYPDGTDTIKTLSGKYAQTVETVANPSFSGYTFNGWYTLNNGAYTLSSIPATYPNLDSDLYALWTANNYTLSLNANGGSGGTSSVTATYGSALPNITSPKKTGYTFAGYFADGQKTSMTSTVTDKGSYSRIDFKASGNGWNLTTAGDKGRHLTAVIILEDSSLTTAPGLQFNDKNLDASMCKVEAITNGWKYTVDFNITEAMLTASETVAYDTNFRFIDITKTTKSSVITVSSATLGGNMYYGADGKGVRTSDFTANDTLYAHWTANMYYLNIKGILDGVEDPGLRDYATVDVYVNGVKVKDDVDDYWTMHPYGSTYEIKDIKVADGRTFIKSESTALSGTMDVAGEKTIYLKFISNTYTVSFDANGGICDVTSKSVTFDSVYGELPISEKKGSVFAGWYTEAEGGTKVTPDTVVSIAGNHTLYAHWDLYKYKIDAQSADSYMTVRIDGGDPETLGYVYQTSLSEGTEVTLTAMVNKGETRDFMFWVDDRGRIVSYEPEYTFILEADKKIKAIYSEDINSEYFTVAFVDSILKTVIDIQQVKKGESAKIPTTLADNKGYVFDHWDTDTTVVNDNLIVNAVYRPLNKMFTITTVIGDKAVDSKYYYNTKVKIEITDSQIPEGKYFGGWSINGGETIASYDRIFDFYVYDDITVTAVFTDKEVEAKATVTLGSSIIEVNESEAYYRANFMVTRELPENLVLVSSGLLLTQSSAFAEPDKLTFEEQSANSNLIKLYRTVHTSNDGQYQLTVKTSTSKTLYARGFLVYLDKKTGNIITLYTDVQEINKNS